MARSKGKGDISAHLRSAGVVVTALLIVGTLVGVAIGRRALVDRVGRNLETPVATVAFNWPVIDSPARPATGRGSTSAGSAPSTPPPPPRTWMSDTIRADIERVALENLNGNPLDSAALQRTSDALLATGWFTSIDAIRRLSSGKISITASWRAPVAVVRSGGRDHVVSAEGDLLPLSYAEGASGLRVILNPYSPKPDRPGQPWIGGDVQAALSLLAYLQASPVFAQVKGVDVAKHVSEKRLVIVTDQDTRIVWGVAPGQWTAAEPGPAIKLRRLAQLRSSVEFGGRIDAGKPLIDISNPRGVMVDRSALGMTEPAGDESMQTEPPVKPGKPAKLQTAAKGR